MDYLDGDARNGKMGKKLLHTKGVGVTRVGKNWPSLRLIAVEKVAIPVLLLEIVDEDVAKSMFIL